MKPQTIYFTKKEGFHLFIDNAKFSISNRNMEYIMKHYTLFKNPIFDFAAYYLLPRKDSPNYHLRHLISDSTNEL